MCHPLSGNKTAAYRVAVGRRCHSKMPGQQMQQFSSDQCDQVFSAVVTKFELKFYQISIFFTKPSTNHKQSNLLEDRLLLITARQNFNYSTLSKLIIILHFEILCAVIFCRMACTATQGRQKVSAS